MESEHSKRQAKNVGGIVKNHLALLRLIVDRGPLTALTLQEKLGLRDSTFYDMTKRLIEAGWVKKIGSQYVAYDYIDYEREIEDALNKIHDGKMPEMVDSKMIMLVALKVRINENDDTFQKAYYKVLKRFRIAIV